MSSVGHPAIAHRRPGAALVAPAGVYAPARAGTLGLLSLVPPSLGIAARGVRNAADAEAPPTASAVVKARASPPRPKRRWPFGWPALELWSAPRPASARPRGASQPRGYGRSSRNARAAPRPRPAPRASFAPRSTALCNDIDMRETALVAGSLADVACARLDPTSHQGADMAAAGRFDIRRPASSVAARRAAQRRGVKAHKAQTSAFEAWSSMPAAGVRPRIHSRCGWL
jgi:hypothetical protein